MVFVSIKQGCTPMSDIGHRPIEYAECPFYYVLVERTNVPLLSCQRGHCQLVCVCVCNSWTLHSRFCDWLFTHDLNLHLTVKHSHSCLFFIQLYKCMGQRERGCFSVGQRADMSILRGSAQPKHSESSNRIYIQSVTYGKLKKKKKKCFTRSLVVWSLPSLQSKYKRLTFPVGESVTHTKPFSKRFHSFVACLLIISW